MPGAADDTITSAAAAEAANAMSSEPAQQDKLLQPHVALHNTRKPKVQRQTPYEEEEERPHSAQLSHKRQKTVSHQGHSAVTDAQTHATAKGKVRAGSILAQQSNDTAHAEPSHHDSDGHATAQHDSPMDSEADSESQGEC